MVSFPAKQSLEISRMIHSGKQYVVGRDVPSRYWLLQQMVHHLANQCLIKLHSPGHKNKLIRWSTLTPSQKDESRSSFWMCHTWKPLGMDRLARNNSSVVYLHTWQCTFILVQWKDSLMATYWIPVQERQATWGLLVWRRSQRSSTNMRIWHHFRTWE